MTQRCMPLLLINMGGEMMYILEQRLKFQNVGEEKAQKVMQDIIYTMLNKKFLDELFKPQELHSKKTMRQFFEKLAHSSIMRLNETSMDKLYDLMTMTFKYQLVMIAVPEQLLTVTVNHLDGIREILPNDEGLVPLLDNAHAMLMSAYRSCAAWEMHMIRNCLLTFFQEAKVKVSLLLREKLQLETGQFVLFPGEAGYIGKKFEFPGTVRYYENGELSKTAQFPAQSNYVYQNTDKENLNLGDEEGRSTTLGVNMYKGRTMQALQIKGGGAVDKNEQAPQGDELKLLSALINRDAENSGTFDLSLFKDDKEEQLFVTETQKAQNVKNIDARKSKKSMETAISEMKIDRAGSTKKKSKGVDMLDLMDEAASRPATAKKASPARGRPASKGRERSASAKRKGSAK